MSTFLVEIKENPQNPQKHDTDKETNKHARLHQLHDHIRCNNDVSKNVLDWIYNVKVFCSIQPYS